MKYARPTAAFTLTDLLVVLAVLSVLAAVLVPIVAGMKRRSHQSHCASNLGQIGKALQQYANEHNSTLPNMKPGMSSGIWWLYKEQVKGYTGLKGPPSSAEKLFACPDDRGYAEEGEKPRPFCQSQKFSYGSYNFNGVNLPGVPNIAGRDITSISDSARTLLAMEWVAHAPLSWHNSKTGRANTPFYNDAESVVGFVDGHVSTIKIYFDGINPAYSRDPIPGYEYKYSGD
jgi:type II secretory pathway pseudopilin PulG